MVRIEICALDGGEFRMEVVDFDGFWTEGLFATLAEGDARQARFAR